jgi:hypothetical protein
MAQAVGIISVLVATICRRVAAATPGSLILAGTGIKTIQGYYALRGKRYTLGRGV